MRNKILDFLNKPIKLEIDIDRDEIGILSTFTPMGSYFYLNQFSEQYKNTNATKKVRIQSTKTSNLVVDFDTGMKGDNRAQGAFNISESLIGGVADWDIGQIHFYDFKNKKLLKSFDNKISGNTLVNPTGTQIGHTSRAGIELYLTKDLEKPIYQTNEVTWGSFATIGEKTNILAQTTRDDMTISIKKLGTEDPPIRYKEDIFQDWLFISSKEDTLFCQSYFTGYLMGISIPNNKRLWKCFCFGKAMVSFNQYSDMICLSNIRVKVDAEKVRLTTIIDSNGEVHKTFKGISGRFAFTQPENSIVMDISTKKDSGKTLLSHKFGNINYKTVKL